MSSRRIVGGLWVRRAGCLAPAYLGALALLAALGTAPSVPLVTAAVLAGIGVYAAIETPLDDEIEGMRAQAYPVTGRHGEDHRTLALANHLPRIDASPETADQLVSGVHERLRAILQAHVWRTHGVDLTRHADQAQRWLPADLAEFYLRPPAASGLRAGRLDRLLTRIESL